MSDGDRFYKSWRWQTVRAAILERDGYRCRVNDSKCTLDATAVDHVVPIDDGGARLDPENLRASCGNCNRRRAAIQKDRDGWRRSSARIVLVVGPPGAGKSEHVKDRAGPRDVIVDYDQLSQAFGAPDRQESTRHHDVTTAARDAVLFRVRRGEVAAATVWLVSSNPAAETMFPFHEVVTVDPGRDEVLRRCAGQPTWFLRLIDTWYERRSAVAMSGPSREW